MVESFHRPTWAEISLDAIHHNIGQFRNALPADMGIMAVVKANAYGHGAVEVAAEAMRSGADYLAVAFLDEAAQLRNAGITSPILVLGYSSPEEIEFAARLDVAITVYSEDVLHALESTAKRHAERPIRIHIKVDTGMGRIGVAAGRDAISFIDRALQLRGIEVEGLFTHYACADESDKSYTYEQYRRFEEIVSHYRERGIEFRYVHAGNSATGIDTPELSYNMLRLGISMYGFYPSEEVNKKRVDLRPAMAYKTRIVMVKTMPAGSGVSYGATYRTSDDEVIATIPVGYADGFTRQLTGKVDVLVHGVRVPVVGRICMDQCMIHVTGVPDVAIGDEVVLFGRQGDQAIPAEEWAEKLGTIHYEIPCMVNYRVPRVFVRDDGERVKVVNLLGNGTNF